MSQSGLRGPVGRFALASAMGFVCLIAGLNNPQGHRRRNNSVLGQAPNSIRQVCRRLLGKILGGPLALWVSRAMNPIRSPRIFATWTCIGRPKPMRLQRVSRACSAIPMWAICTHRIPSTSVAPTVMVVMQTTLPNKVRTFSLSILHFGPRLPIR